MLRKRPHLVITGGSGLLGLTWAAAVHDRYSVTLVQNRRTLLVPFARVVRADLSQPGAAEMLVATLAPDIVVNTAGLTNVEQCEANPGLAHALNCDMAGSLAFACARHGVSFVHISTDHLSDGRTAFQNEAAPVAPLNHYAESKAAGEAEVTRNNEDALILRTNFFGWGPAHKPSFSDVILTSLRCGQRVDLFEDAWFTPVLARDLVTTAHALVDAGAKQIVNVAGPDRMTKFQFGLELAKAFDLDFGLVRATRLSERRDLTCRPADMSLDDSKLVSTLGGPMPHLHDALTRMREAEASDLVRQTGRSMIPYGRHFLDNEDINAVTDFLKAGQWLTQGPTVLAFEDAIAKITDARYAVAVSSATAGLHISALAAGAKPGKKIITSPITFVASANAASFCGAEVLFCDIDPATANLCPKKVREALEADKSVCAIMPVHFGGLPCDMFSLRALADEFGVCIIEDAAHALGSNYVCGARVGSGKYADMAVFSFHPVKAIALGEGGLVTTNDETTYRKLLRLRSHGINKLDDDFEYPEEAGPWYYEMQELGYNYRITDLQCALGLSQAKKLSAFVAHRRLLADRYDKAFVGWSHVARAQSVDTSISAHHVYVLQIDFAGLGTTRAEFMKELREMAIGSQVHYVPVPMHPYYRNKGYRMDALPNAAAYYERALTIPLYFGLSLDEQDQIIDALAQLTGNAKHTVALTT